MRARVTIGGRSLDLVEGRTYVLGRAHDADVFIDDRLASRRHCAIGLTREGAYVEDLRSANGTMLNGHPIGRAALRHDDRLGIGEVTLAVSVEYEGAAPSPNLVCTRCAKSISFATIGDGDVVELGDAFVCPACRRLERRPDWSATEVAMIETLGRHGYQVTARLSTDGSVAVFRAAAKNAGETVAIKTIHVGREVSPERAARFLREARAESSLRHPNVITVREVQQEDTLVWIVMEFVDGLTLLDEIHRAGSMSPRQALDVALQMAKGLAHVHDSGFIHRNVSPKSVLLTKDGTLKLFDFGLAKDLLDVTAQITAPSSLLGTIGYLAPEQIADPRRVDPRADLYALGGTLYHCLTAKPPFRDATLESRRDPPLEALGQQHPAVAELVRKLLCFEPERRQGTAAETIAAIERCVAEMFGVPGVSGPAVSALLRMPEESTEIRKTIRLVAPGTEGSISGTFDDDELLDLIQSLGAREKTGILELSGLSNGGRLYLRTGRCVAAEAWRVGPTGLPEKTSARGPDALALLLRLGSGRHEFSPRPFGIKKEMDTPVSAAVLEVLRERTARRT